MQRACNRPCRGKSRSLPCKRPLHRSPLCTLCPFLDYKQRARLRSVMPCSYRRSPPRAVVKLQRRPAGRAAPAQVAATSRELRAQSIAARVIISRRCRERDKRRAGPRRHAHNTPTRSMHALSPTLALPGAPLLHSPASRAGGGRVRAAQGSAGFPHATRPVPHHGEPRHQAASEPPCRCLEFFSAATFPHSPPPHGSKGRPASREEKKRRRISEHALQTDLDDYACF